MGQNRETGAAGNAYGHRMGKALRRYYSLRSSPIAPMR